MTTSSAGDEGLFHDELFSESAVADAASVWLNRRISAWTASGVYVLFTFLLYWPVLFGKRFFWEDFFIVDLPARDYSYYMAALKHTIPFWNPYNWAWSPFLADPQTAFWYPPNLLQIALTVIIQPGALHPSVLMPEVMTLLHLPLAALGLFVLTKREFKVADIAALLAGLVFGFGLRMIAEQNHPARIDQLALLPWEMLLLLRGWRSWRYLVGFGIVFGLSFLAGQPQIFFLIAFFFSMLTIAESFIRWKEGGGWSRALQPVYGFAFAMVITVGVAAIQLLPSYSLARHSARSGMSYGEASFGAVHLGHFINFFVPDFYGENPGYTTPVSPIVHEHTWFWYWEAEYYWGTLAEILALVAIVALWRTRRRDDPRTRYLFFTVLFSIFALAFGMGANLHLQWIFWRFVPFFNNFRSPNKMIFFLWFLGAIYTGIGLEILLRNRDVVREHRRTVIWSCAVFLGLNLIAISGVLDLIFPPHFIRTGLWRLILPSVLISACVAGFFYLILEKRIRSKTILIVAALLMVGDLFYWDSGWHRNELNKESIIAQDQRLLPPLPNLKSNNDMGDKLLWLHDDETFSLHANLGTMLRRPIEEVQDSAAWTDVNPVRPMNTMPLVADSARRMAIMGVSHRFGLNDSLITLNGALSFAMLYHDWVVAQSDSVEAAILNDSAFDFHRTIVLREAPQLPLTSERNDRDSISLDDVSENHLSLTAHAATPAILFVNDLYYPAWHATVDGKETKILRAFTSLRAIPLGAGVHRVELRYDDAAFDLGWKITLVTLILALAALLMSRRKSSTGGLSLTRRRRIRTNEPVVLPDVRGSYNRFVK